MPNGLRAIYERFGENVEFQLFDRRSGMNTVVEWEGWEHVSQLESEGTYEHLKHRLRVALDGHEAAGVFAPTPSPKRAASRLAPGTRSFIRQMAENLRTHDPENPKGRLKAQA